MIRIRYLSADPKPGEKLHYWLAWKHRAGYGWLWLKTPWWQWRKRDRRWKEWLRAIGRCHEHGQDRIATI